MIVITVTHPDARTTTHRFDGDRIRIGREADNDLVLDSNACSRYHAEIIRDRGDYKIVDLGSTNGIVVDGSRVDEYPLESECAVDLGDHNLSFSIPQEESPKTVMFDAMAAVSADTTALPSPTEKPPELYLHYKDQGKRKSVKLVAGAEYVIGRSTGVDVVLEDIQCSGRHAVVWWEARSFRIRDLESANGTFVNSKRVDKALLMSGDRITIGQTDIEVSEQRGGSVDDDDLMARTRIDMPKFTAVEQASPASSQTAADSPRFTEPGPGPRWWWAVLGCAAVVIIVLAVASLLWRAFDRRGPAEESPSSTAASSEPVEVIVQVSTVERKELTFGVTAAGSVQPQRRVTVSAEVPGRVVQVPVEQGARVRRGDLLARLDDREIRLKIDEASSLVSRDQLELAREDYERKQRLFEDGAVTRSVLDQAKNQFLGLDSAFKSAQARIGQLRQQLSKAQVTAPIDGIVVQIPVSAGEFVGPGAPLAVIENTAEVLVSVELSDRDVVKMRPLQGVEARSDAYPNKIFQGVVERVGGSANPVTKGFEVEARIANPDGSLRSGMILSLEILLDKRKCLVVPAAALLDESGDQGGVFVVSGGVARGQRVKVGGRKDRDVEVVSGLAEGDTVVVFGQEKLRDGQPVKTYDAE
jgi:membrane fusion protein (multidrug efflux system)